MGLTPLSAFLLAKIRQFFLVPNVQFRCFWFCICLTKKIDVYEEFQRDCQIFGWFNCQSSLVGQLVLVMAIQAADEWSNKLFLTGNHPMESADRAGFPARAWRWVG